MGDVESFLRPGCEIRLLAVCFQLQSHGTASFTDKVAVAPHTQKRAYSLQKSLVFPEAPLHARSPRLTQSTLGTFTTMNQENQRAFLTSIHPVFYISRLVRSCSSLERFQQRFFSLSKPLTPLQLFALWSHSILRVILSSCCVYQSPPDTKCWGLIYELAHGFPHHSKLKKAHCTYTLFMATQVIKLNLPSISCNYLQEAESV